MIAKNNNHLCAQIGRHLVVCELARRGIPVTEIKGSNLVCKIIADDSSEHSITITVRTIRSGDWQFKIDHFVEVRFEGEKQILGTNIKPEIPHHIFILVNAGAVYGLDRFYILEWEKLQDIIILDYSRFLAENNGVRPSSPYSKHCIAKLKDLIKYENHWDKIIERF